MAVVPHGTVAQEHAVFGTHACLPFPSSCCVPPIPTVPRDCVGGGGASLTALLPPPGGKGSKAQGDEEKIEH